ncbi:hypothetical protein Igni_0807 [Ignicoccus hospitalis KIN4/I]|uniref:Uncharacterized protein n=1 Tax=Ignicoccus hospitalis (strain KIN4/I / DSM 18386 / JCM 14125) TaxID=453591 RepID=A8AAN7_IGNH4|nr:hypothetical protein Igni_0807 [Ignicoccus hospitalis KIN4/I]
MFLFKHYCEVNPQKFLSEASLSYSAHASKNYQRGEMVQAAVKKRRKRVLLFAEALAKTLLDIWDWGEGEVKEIVFKYVREV